ncbi:helix-turn-helix transcriptional regulator [Paenibacillus silvisoli]|uniref:helix-turn-helix transcriptional regulator n=1 Tax=Paenibacillus silvisoli TaxID=3110539 RepID=UPI0038992955
MKAQGLRAIRKARRWSQGELARLVGCHKNYILDIEHGRRVPSYDLAFQLAVILDVPTYQIMGVFSGEGLPMQCLQSKKDA